MIDECPTLFQPKRNCLRELLRRRPKMQLSKTERILAIINYYLPHTDLNQYHFEADTIAYNTRKNSSLKTVEQLVNEYLGDGLKDALVYEMAVAIKAAL